MFVWTWLAFLLMAAIGFLRAATWAFDDGPVDEMLSAPFARPAAVRPGEMLVTVWSYRKLRQDCDSEFEPVLLRKGMYTPLQTYSGRNSPVGEYLN